MSSRRMSDWAVGTEEKEQTGIMTSVCFFIFIVVIDLLAYQYPHRRYLRSSYSRSLHYNIHLGHIIDIFPVTLTPSWNPQASVVLWHRLSHTDIYCRYCMKTYRSGGSKMVIVNFLYSLEVDDSLQLPLVAICSKGKEMFTASSLGI